MHIELKFRTHLNVEIVPEAEVIRDTVEPYASNQPTVLAGKEVSYLPCIDRTLVTIYRSAGGTLGVCRTRTDRKIYKTGAVRTDDRSKKN